MNDERTISNHRIMIFRQPKKRTVAIIQHPNKNSAVVMLREELEEEYRRTEERLAVLKTAIEMIRETAA